jgi:hypothetical protein
MWGHGTFPAIDSISDRSSMPTSASYTQFPNIAVSLLMPILEPTEWVCLSYIIRRTYGFAGADGDGEKTDVISFEQFVKGVPFLEGHVLDLGTGLGRPAIKRALAELEEKRLITSLYACSHCGWRQAEGAPDPTPLGKAKSPSCPDCKKRLSFSYGIAEMTAKKLASILNEFDPKGREFTWSPEQRAYRVEVPEDSKRQQQREQDLEAEAARLRDRLWFPDLVDACLALAEGALKAGHKISMSRKVNGFYRPVIELQETYTASPLIKYALEQTIERKVPAGKRSLNWWHYPKAICENNKTNRKYSGAPVDRNTNAEQALAHSLPVMQDAVRELLRRAADLNGRGEQEAARALLFDILADVNIKAVGPLFAGDLKLADHSLREAFKQGVSDFVGIDPADSLGLDFYSDWSWSDEVPTPRQRRRARESQAALAG